MSNIPEARAIITKLMPQIQEPDVRSKLAHALHLMHRKPPIKRARQRNVLTAEKRAAVLALARRNPDLHLADIAEIVGLNPGRVSEILNEGGE